MTTKVLRVHNYGQTTPEYVEINVTNGQIETIPGQSGSPVTSANALPTTDAGCAFTVKHGIMSGSAGPWTAYKSGSGGATAGSAFVTDSPVAGQKLVVMDLLFSVDTAMTLTFFEEGDYVNSAIGPFYSLSPGVVYQITLRGNPYKLFTADKRLAVLSSVAGNIMVDPDYYSVPA